ncbi:MAG: hypothetical protein EHM23_27760 [Acidobacteria bacterium]|nr:MAG: hypothetical protein EHM23_27760 [Acidobacteriota bacterium]
MAEAVEQEQFDAWFLNGLLGIGGNEMKKLLVLFAFTSLAFAQSGTIGTGTSISVRTTEKISVKKSDGRIFAGIVDMDVRDANNNVAIPRGSQVELTVKQLAKNNLVLDLESVTVGGKRFGISADDAAMGNEQKDGIGKNKRTAEYIGGGAVLGTIIGAIAGGKKGAAIGAAAGAGAGAGAQVLTRGKKVDVPKESLLTFRLDKSLRMGVAGNRITRNGRLYRQATQ